MWGIFVSVQFPEFSFQLMYVALPHNIICTLFTELCTLFTAPNGYKSQEFLFYIKTRQNKNFKTFILFL